MAQRTARTGAKRLVTQQSVNSAVKGVCDIMRRFLASGPGLPAGLVRRAWAETFFHWGDACRPASRLRAGLMYARAPAWLPCRLQIYFNVHHWLAAQLRKEGIAFAMEDNALVKIADWKRAQELALPRLSRDPGGRHPPAPRPGQNQPHGAG